MKSLPKTQINTRPANLPKHTHTLALMIGQSIHCSLRQTTLSNKMFDQEGISQVLCLKGGNKNGNEEKLNIDINV